MLDEFLKSLKSSLIFNEFQNWLFDWFHQIENLSPTFGKSNRKSSRNVSNKLQHHWIWFHWKRRQPPTRTLRVEMFFAQFWKIGSFSANNDKIFFRLRMEKSPILRRISNIFFLFAAIFETVTLQFKLEGSVDSANVTFLNCPWLTWHGCLWIANYVMF